MHFFCKGRILPLGMTLVGRGGLFFTVFCPPRSAAKRGTARRGDERLAVRGGGTMLLSTTDGLSLVKEIPV